MVIPVYTATGQPDATRLDEWRAVCNECKRRAPIAKIQRWFVASRPGCDAHYCTRCKRALERRLIREALGPPFPRFVKLYGSYLMPKFRKMVPDPQARFRLALSAVFFLVGALLVLLALHGR